MSGDEGVEVKLQKVAAIGGAEGRAGLSSDAQEAVIVASAHVGDAMRSEGVNYNTDQSIGVSLDTGAYPAGTSMGDSTPGDDIN